jgi:1-acyl-sn-glycerol-3-phosphate acyltransferase
MATIISLHLIPIAIGVAVLKKDVMWAIRRRQRIAAALVRFLQVRVEQTGVARDGNYLYICNHQSYIDPVVKAQAVAFLPVAKAEVSKWPLFGFGVKVTGILFVTRENKESRADTRAAIRKALAEGKPVLIYPEGTTSDQPRMLPLRPGAFQTAAELGIEVIPVAISYPDKSDAWIGSESFLAHFVRVFGKKELQVRLHFGEPVLDRNGTTLMEKTAGMIDLQLAEWAATDADRQRQL